MSWEYRGGSRGRARPSPPHVLDVLGKRKRIAEGRKAGRASDKKNGPPPLLKVWIRHLEYFQKDCNHSIEQNELLQIRIVSHTFDIGRFNNFVGFVTSR